ncbi:hypothetical protein Acife_3245 [Acidithiobacillus ferrivorans SS3]|uniref:Uncharacterized protein n=1 Tax=Acidithiobacillus ferrivorans SS3 TaxID=743299 RepID=G0JME1_9PROT|nr:hypothetical protein Acife_3245 [Acidithiobacillus ferrivorans SS3]
MQLSHQTHVGRTWSPFNKGRIMMEAFQTGGALASWALLSDASRQMKPSNYMLFDNPYLRRTIKRDTEGCRYDFVCTGKR